MFDLAEIDPATSLLDCAAGPASFNAEMTGEGRRVVSCDPMYGLSVDAIGERIRQGRQAIMEGVYANRDCYVWTTIPSPEALERVRMSAMTRFLEDFPQGVAEGRYLPDALPKLRFEDGTFDVALCSHFLFTYSERLSARFHIDAAREMCRVAKQVRIFPLVDMVARPSPHVRAVADALEGQGLKVEIERVDYEFQKGGDHMLRITVAPVAPRR